MEHCVFKTAEEAAKKAAAEVAELIRENRIAIIGISAGRTFDPFYKELVRYHKQEDVSMHKFRSFQTCEYLGLPGTHPMSKRFYLVEHFFKHVPVPRRYMRRLPGLPIKMEATCKKFEQRIKSVDGINLLVLGIGRRGQLAFNEKGSSFNSRTRQVYLSNDFREEYAKDFPRGAVPHRGITMGIATILEAQRIIVLVTDPDRSEALKRMLTGPITPSCPASALRNHPSVTIYADQKTAGKVPAATY